MGRHNSLLQILMQALLVAHCAAVLAPSGSRRKLQYTWTPPTPPISVHPCPRTQVPDAANSRTLWIDPSYTGTVAVGNTSHPFKDLKQAWAVVPKTKLTTGITINIKPGLASSGSLHLANVWATAEAPLIIQRDPTADPTAEPAAVLQWIRVTNCSYVYFKDIVFEAPNAGAGSNVVWISLSDYIYLLNVRIAGYHTWPLTYGASANALKVHNSRGIYVEDSNVYGSSPGGMALNFYTVQYGHICRSNIHHSDWCFTLTSGTSYFLVDSNSVHHCGQAGLAVGYSSSSSDMIAPWLQYHTYGVKVTNNVIHDVWGAGLSVYGGYNVLMAHNTLYKVGSRSHTVEIMTGTRGCWSTAVCAAYYAMGGWGPSATGTPVVPIPTKNVMFLNNLIVNPTNESAKWAHFAMSNPINTTGTAVPSSLPNPVTVTDGLVIRGNVFVNWKADPKYTMGLGITACAPDADCYAPTVLANNLINVPGLDITFTDSDTLVLSEASKQALSTAAYRHAVELPFSSWLTLIETPTGHLANEVPYDKTGAARRPDNDLPGAYYDPAYQPSRVCATLPNPDLAINSTGWPMSCVRAFVGSSCTAPCGSEAVGVDYVAQCTDVDVWTLQGGQCITKSCSAPPNAAFAPNSVGWNQSCAGALIGSTCSAPCAANATGSQYTAKCTDTNTWTLTGGECIGPQKAWTPPTPPLPAYPCPRTEVPTHLSMKTIWVDPAYTGAVTVGTPSQPFKTFVAAWRSLPRSPLTAGVTINIKPGVALSGRLWMDNVWATAEAPLIIQRDPTADPAAGPSVLEIIDVYNCTYLYFKGITFRDRWGGGNVVHFASSHYIYLLNVTIAGNYTWPINYPGSTQALKVNQVQGLYVEDSDIFGSCPNGVGLDGVAVQYGHVCRTNIHHADWCMYLKGGSAYFLIDSNEVHHCGQAGLEVGQGTGFEFMTTPWLQYEGYDMKLTNNVIYDVWGAGLGVNGGYSILMAHNSLYRVGRRSHTIEFNFGGRGCGNNVTCKNYFDQGGWGPAAVGDPKILIPNKDILFLNNILVNPSNESAMWTHFGLSNPINLTTNPKAPPSLPNPSTASDGLVIRGNVFVNWKANPKYTMALGLSSCAVGSTCYPATVLAENLINVPGLDISFTDLQSLVMTESSKAALQAAGYKHAVEVPFSSWSTLIETPTGQLANEVPYDRAGAARSPDAELPGAWV